MLITRFSLQGVGYTKEQVIAWLKTFCKGDPLDEEFRRRIIDVFINSVYLYDNKMVVFYNIRDGKQVNYIDVMNAMDELDEDADLGGIEDGAGVRISNAPPRQNKKDAIWRLFCIYVSRDSKGRKAKRPVDGLPAPGWRRRALAPPGESHPLCQCKKPP